VGGIGVSEVDQLLFLGTIIYFTFFLTCVFLRFQQLFLRKNG
jgi:hypothetical protein